MIVYLKAVWPTDELPSDVLARDGSSYLQVLEDLFLRVSLILSLGYLSVASLKQPRPREAPTSAGAAWRVSPASRSHTRTGQPPGAH